MSGKHIKCKNCSGYGLVLDMNGEPNDCFTCFGSGYNWYPPKDLTKTSANKAFYRPLSSYSGLDDFFK